MSSSRKRKRKSAPQGPPPGGVARTTPAVNIHGRRFLIVLISLLVAAELLFVFLDATVNYAHGTTYGQFRRLCNITREDGLASWFGTTQTFLAGLVLLLIYFLARRDRRRPAIVAGWLILAIFFLYMAADDGAQIHERIGSVFKKAHAYQSALVRVKPEAASWGSRALHLFPSYPWQLLFVPFFAGVGLFMLVFLWRELGESAARAWVAVALLCFASAIALDFIEGLDPNHPLNAYTWIETHANLDDFALVHFDKTPYDMARHFSKSIEEFLEMLSTTILLAVFIRHFMRRAGELRIVFTGLSARKDTPGA